MGATTVDYQLLGALVAISDEGSFSKAAARLGVTKGTVSRAIARLEELVGTELVHRTTHKVSLSTAGVALYERTAPHLRALQQSVGKLPEAAEEPSGELRITAPTDLGVMVLPSVLAQLSMRYPDVRFDIRLTNATVDLVAERFDLALRATTGKLALAGLWARRIGNTTMRYYASPEYLARRGTPRMFGDPSHDWVAFARSLPHAGRVPSGYRPRFKTDDFFLLRELVRDGAGVGPMPAFIAQPYLQAGTLQDVLTTIPTKSAGGLYLVHPASQHVPRRVIAFRELLFAYLKGRPLDEG